jgi:hypothetical protein
MLSLAPVGDGARTEAEGEAAACVSGTAIAPWTSVATWFQANAERQRVRTRLEFRTPRPDVIPQAA